MTWPVVLRVRGPQRLSAARIRGFQFSCCRPLSWADSLFLCLFCPLVLLCMALTTGAWSAAPSPELQVPPWAQAGLSQQAPCSQRPQCPRCMLAPLWPIGPKSSLLYA